MSPFEVKDCALLVRMSGLSPAINLRELRERIAVASENVLYHHFCEPLLRPAFDNPDYRNDFAVWVKLYLGDRVLAERLGILDPFSMSSLEELRTITLDVIDERLSEVPRSRPPRRGTSSSFSRPRPSCSIRKNGSVPPGTDGGHRKDDEREHLLPFSGGPPSHSHGKDDFTAWLREEEKKNARYIRALESIDFYFHSLSKLKEEIVAALSRVDKKR